MPDAYDIAHDRATAFMDALDLYITARVNDDRNAEARLRDKCIRTLTSAIMERK